MRNLEASTADRLNPITWPTATLAGQSPAITPGLPEQTLCDAEWNDPARVQLQALVATQCALVNELYSLQEARCELGDYRQPIQAVSSLMESDDLSVQRAINGLAGDIAAIANDYVLVRDEMLSEPMISDAFREYCHRLEAIMAGNLRYVTISRRYYGADFIGGIRTITVPAPLEANRQRQFAKAA